MFFGFLGFRIFHKQISVIAFLRFQSLKDMFEVLQSFFRVKIFSGVRVEDFFGRELSGFSALRVPKFLPPASLTR